MVDMDQLLDQPMHLLVELVEVSVFMLSLLLMVTMVAFQIQLQPLVVLELEQAAFMVLVELLLQ